MAGMNDVRRRILMNSPHEEALSGSLVTFNSDMPRTLTEFKIDFLPIKNASSRSVYGYSQISFAATGKNKFPAKTEFGHYVNQNGNVASSNAYNSFIVPVPYGKNVYLSTYQVNNIYQAFFIGAEEIDSRDATYSPVIMSNRTSYTWSSSSVGALGRRFIISTAHTKVTNPSDFWNDYGYVSIDFGSERHTETPKGEAYVVNLPATIYGGSFDALTGKLESWWGYISSYARQNLPGEWISSMDTYTPGSTPSVGSQVAYKLSEPVIFHLTPYSIKTLEGINNIWSNTNGTVSIKYWTH